MKIDDKMMNYEISKHLPKSKPDPTEKVEDKQPISQERAEGTAQSEQDTIVNLSQASREVQLIREAIASEPEVREDKVAELKQRIESGQYEVDHKAVADKLVDGSIDEIL